MRLYQQVMGQGWDALPAEIVRAHSSSDTLHGSFEVGHGAGWLARALVRLLRLPPAASELPVTLCIHADEAAEQWRRTFGGRPLTTTQRCREPGILDEQLSVLELRFRLEAAGNALRYDQIGARVRVGPLTMPWPRWCRPQVDAVETAESGRVRVVVEVSLPQVGLLIAYRGRLDVPPSRP